MFRITCQHETDANGAIVLRSSSWRLPANGGELDLQGELAVFWQVLVELDDLPQDEQREIIDSMEPEMRRKFVKLASALSAGGYLDLDAGFELSAIQAPRAPLLQKLHLELTHRCNFRCAHCYIGPKLRRPNANVSEGTTSQWMDVLTEAHRLGCGHVTFTGGEPFVRADALSLIQHSSMLGMIAEVNTNASCISPGLAKKLADCTIGSVEVSVYGHDAGSAQGVTGVAASYEAAIHGIEHLATYDVPVSVKYFGNSQDQSRFAALMKRFSETSITFKAIGPEGVHGDIFSGGQAYVRAEDLLRPRFRQPNPLPCYPTANGLAIEPDGTIRACPKLTAYFGNAFDGGLRRVWVDSSRLRQFREFWIEFCRQNGYTSGAERTSLCPAAHLLGHARGLETFKDAWQAWQAHQ